MNWFILAISIMTSDPGLPHPPSVAESSGDLLFYLDKAIFLINDSLFYAEVYYFLDLTTLDVEKDYISRYRVHILLEDLSGEKKPLEDKFVKIADRKIESQFVIDKFDLIIAPGKYNLTVEIEDLIGKNKGIAQIPIEVERFSKSPALSDIELAWVINGDTANSPFRKYGINVVPNPLSNYNDEKDTLYFFVEIYNLIDDTGRYVLNYGIYDTLDNLYIASKPKIKKKDGSKAVQTGGIILSQLKEGMYKFILEVVDLSNGKRTRREKFFSFSKRISAQLTPELESILSFIDYFATPEELETFKNIEGEGKRLFLLKFWKKRDPNPETPENEFLEKFIERVKYADANFTTPVKKGRYTDRGRIYIKYGPPDEIERVTVAFGEKDREHWIYYGEGGMEFIFVDIRGSGEYKLMYSSIPEEPSAPDWERWIPREEVESEW
jgi:GWxTD domain-containing protein